MFLWRGLLRLTFHARHMVRVGKEIMRLRRKDEWLIVDSCALCFMKSSLYCCILALLYLVLITDMYVFVFVFYVWLIIIFYVVSAMIHLTNGLMLISGIILDRCNMYWRFFSIALGENAFVFLFHSFYMSFVNFKLYMFLVRGLVSSFCIIYISAA